MSKNDLSFHPVLNLDIWHVLKMLKVISKLSTIVKFVKGDNRHAALVGTNLKNLLNYRRNFFDKINQDICVKKISLIRHRHKDGLSFEVQMCDYHVKPSSFLLLSSHHHSEVSEAYEQAPHLFSAA